MIGFCEILFFVVVLLSNIIQCITGFAGTVLAMPFSLMLVGFDTAKPILNILGIVASIGVVATNRKGFNKKEFFKIVSIMLVGMVVGFALTKAVSINAQALYKILGIVVLTFVAIGIINSKSSKNNTPTVIMLIVLAVAGLVHGMFVCGGPLLVIYANDKLKDREEFRVTVSSVWIVLNSVIMLTDVKAGYFNPRLFLLLAISVAILFVALKIGNLIFKKMNRKVFMVVTYVLMAISGVSLLIK